MSLKSVHNPSFKAYVPVVFYAKNPADGKYSRVMKPENVKKCQSFVVRNLNGTAKNMKNDEFVSMYSSVDKDYKSVSAVRSVYDYDNARVLMVTGRDVDSVTQMAKPIGKAKSESIDRTGRSSSFETRLATNDYYRQINSFLQRTCRAVKSESGDKLALQVFFDPKYKKDGQLKAFDYVGSRFVAISDN